MMINVTSVDDVWNPMDSGVTEDAATDSVAPNFPLFKTFATPDSYRMMFLGAGVFGLPGNIFSIIVLMSSAALRQKPVNVFMIHQSVIDAAVCISAILTQTIDDVSYGPSSTTGQNFFCRLWLTQGLLYGTIHASGYNLMFLTLERCWAITNPFKYNPDKVRKRLPHIFILCWIIGIFSMFPNYFASEMVMGNCRLWYGIPNALTIRLTGAYFLTVACLIPGSVMLVSYGMIGMSLNKSKSFQKGDSSTQSDNIKKAQMNLLQTCIILMVMFVLVWLHHTVVYILATGNYFPHLQLTYYPVSTFIIIINSVLNPFVYCVRYKEFQDQAKHILRIAPR